MAYTSVVWDRVSAKNLNHMEGQYDAAKVDIDLHGHPYAHYLEAASDTKFFPIASGMDAQYIDSSDLDDLLGFQTSPGIIVLHSADDSDFTNGYLNADIRWHQCDGGTYNGIKSPDTRGYFPKCPSAVITTGTGGATTQTLSGVVTVGDHTLTPAELPSHLHQWDYVYAYNPQAIFAVGSAVAFNSISNVDRTTEYNHAAADEAHNHSTAAINLNSINLTPAWKAYWFIIKVA